MITLSLTDSAFVGTLTPYTIIYPNVTSGLIGWWKFDEGTGTTSTADSSGNSITGVLVNSPSWITGKIGSYALQFNGSNQSVHMPLNLSSTNIITVTFWLWVNAYSNSDKIGVEYSANFNSANAFIIDIDASDGKTDLDMRYQEGSTAYNGGYITRPSAAAWHHYAIIFDRTTGATLGVTTYIDGSPVTTTMVYAGNCASSNFDNATLYLMSRGSSGLYMAGKLDDFRVYNRALNSSEVTTVFNWHP